MNKQYQPRTGKVLENLQMDNLMNNTIVIWMSDHGDGLPRGKRDVFDTGIHVPCIIWLPEHLRPSWWPSAGAQDDRMVSFLDFAPSLLNIAGIEAPKGLPGFSLFGSPDQMRGEYVFGGKDRMDEALDRVRYARSKSAGGRVSYQLQQLGAKELSQLFHNGSLNAVQARWLSPRLPEEFYDLTQDPLEINNLIDTNSSRDILAQLRFHKACYF